MKTRVLGAVLVILASSLTAISATASPSLRAVSLASPCAQPGPTPTYSHVVWIMLENVGYSVVGSSSAPYLNSLENRCGLATNDVAISHPSLPNYFALTAGSTIGVADDGEPSVHPLNIANIFLQLNGNWRALVESMPTPCDNGTSGRYASRHNPAVYYNNISGSCKRNDVPLSSPLNLSAAFTFISPNVCNDMHNCPTSVGDAWLARYVPQIIASPLYQRRSLVLFITFDESDSSSNNHVPLWVIAPSVPRGRRVSTPFSHYSLLRTTETLLHVAPLRGARTAPSLIGPFHL
jgi:hypothetical protein